jgi:ribosomal protein L18E
MNKKNSKKNSLGRSLIDYLKNMGRQNRKKIVKDVKGKVNNR